MTAIPARWLLLAHQLPSRPSNARVKTWRRLQQIGAVSTRNSVYVLPNTEHCREDFEWLRAEIAALGGEATVFAADALNQDGDEDIMSAFQRARQPDYLALKRESDRLAGRARSSRVVSSRRDGPSRAVRELRERLNEVRRVDFFNAPGGQAAADAIAVLEEQLAGPAIATKEAAVRLSVKDFTKRRWVTRPRPGVDRMASAWLIRRHIDPRATFAFVDNPGDTDVAFDMYVGQFGHDGVLCTFEVLAKRFGLVSPAITRIGQIVHDLDLKELRYGEPEAPTVGRLVDGLQRMHATDEALLEQGIALFETLARSFESSDSATPPTRAVKQRASSPRRRRTRS